MANDPIQIKRGASADLPTLSQAEFAITTDNDELFIGNGSENIEVVTEGASIRILSDFQDTNYDDGQVPTWNDADSRFEPGEGGSGGGLTWQIISSDTTASKDNGYLIDASGGDVTLTLPSSPSEGDMVGVCDYMDSATTNTITIDRNGEKIEGDDSDLTIDIDGSGMTLVYTDSGRGWDIVSEIGGGGGDGGVSTFIGQIFPLWDHLDGVSAPDNSGDATFVKLTAGEDGSGEYNEGLLKNETISGSAPEIDATAEIATGPLEDELIHLINTEESFVRPRETSGFLQFDQMQKITGTATATRGLYVGSASGAIYKLEYSGQFYKGYSSNNFGFGLNSSMSPDARVSSDTDGETRSKNVSATFYMRIE